MRFLLVFLRDETGPAAVEYALVLALVVVAIVAAVSAMGQSSGGIFSSMSQAVKQNGS